MSIWTSIITGLTGPVATYLTRRAELKAQAAQNQLELLKAQGERQVQLALAGLTADANWEQEFARQASSSWKDEYTLLVVSIPAILAFVHASWLDGPRIVKEGFLALGETPLWYQGMFLSLFLATVGIRYWRRTQSDT
jgi:hypothetical protein